MILTRDTISRGSTLMTPDSSFLVIQRACKSALVKKLLSSGSRVEAQKEPEIGRSHDATRQLGRISYEHGKVVVGETIHLHQDHAQQTGVGVN